MPFWPGKKTVRVQNNKRCDFDSLINGRQNAVEHAQKKGPAETWYAQIFGKPLLNNRLNGAFWSYPKYMNEWTQMATIKQPKTYC